jgi:hypothetical protein
MVRANRAKKNDKPDRVWMLGSRTFTSYPEYLRARERAKRQLEAKFGKTFWPPIEIPDWATPENFGLDGKPPKLIDQPLDSRERLVSAAELDAGNYQARYLIPGILAAGEPGGIYGPAKSLKTSLAADLLISLASGTPFLGRFPVPEPGKVIFFSCRAGLAGMQSLARRICRERGLSLAALSNFSLSTDLPQLDRGDDLVSLCNLVEREKPVCVVIDPAGLALTAEKRRDRFYLGAVLDVLGEVFRSVGCALLVVHHCKRSTKVGRPATLDDVAGSGFAEFSAQWLLLSRRRAADPASGHHELWLSAGNGAGHQGLWALDIEEGNAPPVPEEGPIAPADPESRTWKTTLHSAAWAEARADEQWAQAKEDRRLRRWKATYACHRARVLKYLIAYPNGRTANGIRDALGINGIRMKRILDELLEEGLLETGEIKHPNRTDIVYLRTLKCTAPAPGAGRGTAPAPGAAGAGSHGMPESAGTSDPRGAREKSGPHTRHDTEVRHVPNAPSPRPPFLGKVNDARDDDALDANRLPSPLAGKGPGLRGTDGQITPPAAEKSGPDTFASGHESEDSMPPGSSKPSTS